MSEKLVLKLKFKLRKSFGSSRNLGHSWALAYPRLPESFNQIRLWCFEISHFKECSTTVLSQIKHANLPASWRSLTKCWLLLHAKWRACRQCWLSNPIISSDCLINNVSQYFSFMASLLYLGHTVRYICFPFSVIPSSACTTPHSVCCRRRPPTPPHTTLWDPLGRWPPHCACHWHCILLRAFNAVGGWILDSRWYESTHVTNDYAIGVAQSETDSAQGRSETQKIPRYGTLLVLLPS